MSLKNVEKPELWVSHVDILTLITKQKNAAVFLWDFNEQFSR